MPKKTTEPKVADEFSLDNKEDKFMNWLVGKGKFPFYRRPLFVEPPKGFNPKTRKGTWKELLDE